MSFLGREEDSSTQWHKLSPFIPCPLSISQIRYATSWTQWLEGFGGSLINGRADLWLGELGKNYAALEVLEA